MILGYRMPKQKLPEPANAESYKPPFEPVEPVKDPVLSTNEHLEQEQQKALADFEKGLTLEQQEAWAQVEKAMTKKPIEFRHTPYSAKS